MNVLTPSSGGHIKPEEQGFGIQLCNYTIYCDNVYWSQVD
jgi:hypothetical protein